MVDFTKLNGRTEVFYIDRDTLDVKSGYPERTEEIGYHGSGSRVVYLRGVRGHFLTLNLFLDKDEANDDLNSYIRSKIAREEEIIKESQTKIKRLQERIKGVSDEI